LATSSPKGEAHVGRYLAGNLRAIEALVLDLKPSLSPAARPGRRRPVVRAQPDGAGIRHIAAFPVCRAAPESRGGGRSDFAGQIVSTILDLRAWELRGTVTTLFERELVDPSFCGELDEVLEELEPGSVFNPDSYHFPSPITDAWEAVRGWCFFDELNPANEVDPTGTD